MPRDGKRDKLIDAAKAVIYQHGAHNTTLADIAEVSGVPLGNIYYYFKTKDSLVEAVIRSRLDDISGSLALLELDPDPLSRLKALARSGQGFLDELVRYGCPYGTLCQEVEKQDSPVGHAAADLFRLQIDWAQRQFSLLGLGNQSYDLAVDLLSSIQGAFLLTYTLRQPEIVQRKINRLESWLDQVADSRVLST